MTGNEFRALRKRSGLGKTAFAWELGYKGNYNTVKRMIVRTEAFRDKPIPWQVEERVKFMLAKEPKFDLLERPKVGQRPESPDC